MASLTGALGGAGQGALAGLGAGGPLGAAAGGLIGGLTGLFSGGATPQSTANKAILGNVPGQLNTANSAINTGLQGLGAAGRFYNTILSGNKDAISNLLAPQVSTVLGQYDNAAKSVAQFAPRGGGATQTLAQLPFQKATAAGNAYQGVLPSAAAGAASVGSAEGNIGGNELATTTGLSPSLSGFQTQQNQLQASGGAGLSKSIANQGAGLGALLGKLLGQGGGSSGAGPIGVAQSGDGIFG